MIKKFEIREVVIGSLLKLSRCIPNIIKGNRDREFWDYIKRCYEKYKNVKI